MILGTAAYMAPEQARGTGVDKRADIWALGCVLFEMLSGRRPFDGESAVEVMSAVLRSEPNWSALADVSPGIRQLIRVCLQKDVRQRLAHAQDVRLAMDGAFDISAAVPIRRSISRALAPDRGCRSWPPRRQAAW